MKRYCKYCWVILGLFLLGNIFLLSVWWLRSDRCDLPFKKDRFSREKYAEHMRHFFKEKAGIDSVQFEEIHSLRMDYYKMLEPIKRNVDSLKKELAFYTFSDQKDSLVEADLINQIVNSQREIEYLNCEHYKNVREVCYSEEQKKRLDQAFKDFIEEHHKRHRRDKKRK